MHEEEDNPLSFGGKMKTVMTLGTNYRSMSNFRAPRRLHGSSHEIGKGKSHKSLIDLREKVATCHRLIEGWGGMHHELFEVTLDEVGMEEDSVEKL